MALFFLIDFLIVIAVILYFVIGYCIQSGKDSDARKIQTEINQNVRNYFESKNFKETKTYYLVDNATNTPDDSCKKFISVNYENKKIALVDYEKRNLLIVDFDNILGYEIYENGGTVTTGGHLGGYLGGFFGAETEGKCKELSLIIKLNKYDTPQVVYKIISETLYNAGINKSNILYKECLKTLQEVASFLDVVKNENLTASNRKKKNEKK